LQHVIVRGIEKREIFNDDQDRKYFFDRFAALLNETGVKCYAWALIPNHFHLLLMPTGDTLASFMRRLLTSYAVYFNRRNRRTGHLFQNRYKSIVCEEETYLLELVRYIHINPLRAGLVKSLEELEQYPWSGHAVLTGTRELKEQEQYGILSRFGNTVATSRAAYRKFLADGIASGKRDDLVGGGLKRSRAKYANIEEWGNFDERVLGSGGFVDMLQQHEVLRERITTPLTLSELISRVATAFNLPEDSMVLPGKARPVAEARGVVACLAIRELGYKGIEVGRELNLTSSGVSIALRRGIETVKKRPEFKKEILVQSNRKEHPPASLFPCHSPPPCNDAE